MGRLSEGITINLQAQLRSPFRFFEYMTQNIRLCEICDQWIELNLTRQHKGECEPDEPAELGAVDFSENPRDDVGTGHVHRSKIKMEDDDDD